MPNFLSARMRIILAAVGVIVVAIGVGLYVHHRIKAKEAEGFAEVTSAPQVESIPGAGTTTRHYVATQVLQNIQQEEKARREGRSDVPTITRPDFVGNPSVFGVTKSLTQGGGSRTVVSGLKECPIKKVVVMYKPNPASCTEANLRIARQTGVTAEELVCQGCSCPSLKLAGYTVGELKAIGYSANQLKDCGFTLAQLVEAGFSAAQLKAAGYNAKQLADAGFTPGELAAAGFTPSQLAAAGFSPAQIQAAEEANQANNPNCNVAKLKADRAKGMSAKALREMGCGVAALKAAGFTAAQLKAAGFTAAQLKDAGFTAGQLKAAGFTAAQLKNAGFTAAQLKKAGFTAGQLKAAGFNATQLRNAGFTNKQLADAGFTPAQIKAADANATICNVEKLKRERLAGVSATQLRSEGCGLAALKAAGFNAAQLKAAGFTAKQLKAAGFTAAQLKNAGFSAKQLKAAGFTAAQLKNAGFSAAQLKNAGFSAKQLKDAGFTAAQLKNAGFNAAQLKDAGFTAAQLKNAGFSAGQLKDAGFTAAQLKNAGFSAKQLRNAGFSAAQLKAAGFTPSQLKAAGYTRGDLLRAGFTPAQAGYAAAPTAAQQAAAQQAAAQQAAAAAAAARQRAAAARQVTTGPTAGQPGQIGATIPSIASDSPEARLEQIARQQQRLMNAQQRQDAVAQAQGAMMVQAQKLLAGWSQITAQVYAKAPEPVAPAAGSGAEGQNGLQAQTAKNLANSGDIIKAGTVMFAVLDTSINSDERSPVMATIVMGPLKGARLLGQFERVNKRVLLTFRLLNDPLFPHSIAMNAVAIDPDTARTAVAGQVNNHYLLRYGSLFGSAFLEGLSTAILSSNNQQSCIGPICWSSPTNLSVAQQIAVGLGTVGNRYAEVMGDNFNRPPTIRIQGGTGIGILFMSDLTLPASPESQMYQQAQEKAKLQLGQQGAQPSLLTQTTQALTKATESGDAENTQQAAQPLTEAANTVAANTAQAATQATTNLVNQAGENL